MAKDTFGRGPQNYKGTRDYDGIDAQKRNFVTNQIREVFESFGFEPLDTPAIELTRILDGKYGEDGQSKIFKLASKSEEPLGGLRYDHTVPLARFMAMYPNKKVLPYRRYAIGKVWRNESTQAGRYREFTQCDFDTVGSGSLVVDAEILAINYQILERLRFPTGAYTLQFNDRRLLNAMTASINAYDTDAVEILRAWDKIEKVGLDSTANELREKKIAETVVNGYLQLTNSLFDSKDPFQFLSDLLGKESIRQIELLYFYAQSLGVPDNVLAFNPLLARGLDYYTGPIFETVIESAGIGSITGGGRFDNLVAVMGGPDLPASGSSFGLERVIGVMDKLGIEIPVRPSAPVFVTLFDQNDLDLVEYSFKVASKLRLDGIPVEVYTGNNPKLGRQIEIASKKKSKIVIIAGENEIAQQTVTMKILETGNQYTVSLNNLASKIKSLL